MDEGRNKINKYINKKLIRIQNSFVNVRWIIRRQRTKKKKRKKNAIWNSKCKIDSKYSVQQQEMSPAGLHRVTHSHSIVANRVQCSNSAERYWGAGLDWNIDIFSLLIKPFSVQILQIGYVCCFEEIWYSIWPLGQLSPFKKQYNN